MDTRLAYLEALGIPSWERRSMPQALENPATEQPAEPPVEAVQPSTNDQGGLNWAIGAGDSPCLLLVDDAGQSALDIANDLGRALGQVPVWAWPEESARGTDLEQLAADRLLTGIVFFGPALANLAFRGVAPERIGQAKVTVLPDLTTLKVSAEARKACWSSLLAAGVVRRR
jgi:hypothetical protein